MKHFAFIAFLPIACIGSAHAALTDNLTGYYSFEESGVAGLANQAPAATTHNGAFLGAPSDGAGAGFAGNSTFAGTNQDAGTDATTNRGKLLVGKSLNLVKGTTTVGNGGQFTVATLTSRGPGTGGDFGTLGTQFSVSTWFYLAPDSDNSTLAADALRNFVFESALDGVASTAIFDISWGSILGAPTTYSPYVGQTQITAANSIAVANAWHNVVHTFSVSEANTTMNVYVDGNLVGSGSALTTSVDFRGINFGANRSGARVFDGMLDEIGIWNRPLAAAEVTEVYQRGLS